MWLVTVLVVALLQTTEVTVTLGSFIFDLIVDSGLPTPTPDEDLVIPRLRINGKISFQIITVFVVAIPQIIRVFVVPGCAICVPTVDLAPRLAMDKNGHVIPYQKKHPY